MVGGRRNLIIRARYNADRTVQYGKRNWEYDELPELQELRHGVRRQGHDVVGGKNELR
jgi:hypothetical protein